MKILINIYLRDINNYDLILLVVKCVPMKTNKQIISHIVLRNYW